MFVWSENFLSHAILLKTITPRNGDNLCKSEMLHMIFAYEFWGTDISALNELIIVPRMIGSRSALARNDVPQCGLYDTTIYQWINRDSVCENYAFLLSYGQYGEKR